MKTNSSNNTLHHYSKHDYCWPLFFRIMLVLTLKKTHELHQNKLHCCTALASHPQMNADRTFVGRNCTTHTDSWLTSKPRDFLNWLIREYIQLPQFLFWKPVKSMGVGISTAVLIAMPVFPPMKVIHATDSEAVL